MIWKNGIFARSDINRILPEILPLKKLKIQVIVSFLENFSYSFHAIKLKHDRLQDYDKEKRMIFEVAVNNILTYKNKQKQKKYKLDSFI